MTIWLVLILLAVGALSAVVFITTDRGDHPPPTWPTF
jgi:hypothetical protein